MNKLIAAIEALPDGKKLVYAVSTNEVVHGYNYACTTDDLKALANQLKWIPVSEPPSETGQYIVAWQKNPQSQIVRQMSWYEQHIGWNLKGVIAWRPIPPYIAERGEECVKDERKRIAELEKALDYCDKRCASLHHPKKYQHGDSPECPVEALVNKALRRSAE